LGRVDVLSESSVDTTLGGDSVTSGREQLGHTGGFEASLGKTEGSAQTGTTGTDNDGIVLVILIPVRCCFNGDTIWCSCGNGGLQ
jgi:hypothetical protein